MYIHVYVCMYTDSKGERQRKNKNQHHTSKNICVYGVCVCIYLPNASVRDGCDTSFFKIFKQLWIQNFPFPNLVAKPTLLFAHSWRENSWIHTFPGVSALHEMQKKLVQDFNSVLRDQF